MKRKRFLILLLLTALLLALLPVVPARAAGGIWSGGATQPPGVGSFQSPYQISTGEHLKWLANEVNKGNTAGYAILTADIVLNDTSTWQSWGTSPPASPWTPIGNAANIFKGVFDGQGHTVSGVYINSTNSYQGLFGYIGTDGMGTVKNVKVASSYIKGQSYVGGICGYMNFFSEINSCTSSATVIGTSDYSGGITGSVAKNSSLRNCRNTGSVTGGYCTGGITGINNGTVMGCVNQGAVGGSGSWIGGLIGMNYFVLSNSYNNGSVSASGNYVGGICGTNDTNGTITNVYNTGSVTGGWPVCGNTLTGSSLTNVYYLGASMNNGIGSHLGTGAPVNKSAEQFASGEVAYLMGDEYGQTPGLGGDPWPVFRTSDNSNAVYRLTYMNGATVHAAQYYNAGAAVSFDGITPPVMDDEFFLDWEGLPDIMPVQDVTVTANFTPILILPQITTTSPLPFGATHKAYSARIEATGTKPITFTLASGALPAGLTLDGGTGEITGTPTEAESSTVTIRAQNDQGYDDKQFIINISDEMPGSGTSGNPYQISTASHLMQFADKVNTSTSTRFYAVLMADIALNDTSDWEDWETNAPAHTWTPIGISSTYNFKGGFDGNNHTISGVYINSSDNYQGLFGYISAVTTVKNLNLVNSYIKGNENVGGICGTLMSLCKIENCRNAAIVRGEKYAGGVCGSVSANNASILNCHNEGSVTGSLCVGGIAGSNAGTISGCHNSGTAQGSAGVGRSIGGICGENSSTVTNVYNTGSVSGENGIGGICGVLSGMAAKTATLTGAYNRGNVAGSSNNAAICGVTNAYCALSSCYYLDSSSTSGIGYNAGAFTTVAKSGEQFASGEVAYLLGTAFGQTLNEETYPVFRSSNGDNTVYRLVYMNEAQQHAVQYYNAGNTVSAAGISAPSKGGHYFSHWEGLPSSMTAGDATVSAVFLPITVPTDKTLVSITAPTAVTGVANGTAKTAAALGLPAKVTLVTNDGNVQADVTWDVASSSHDPDDTAEQTFEVAGTVTLPSGVVNPDSVSLEVSVSVTVNAAASTDKTLISVTAPTAITGVANGTAKTAAALGLPAKVTLVTDDGDVQADVTWDVAACGYDPDDTAEQTFEVEGEVTLPEGVVNPNSVSLDVSVDVTVNEAQIPIYSLTVVNGTGNGSYAAGAQVSITANAAPSGQVFDRWITSGGGSFTNANSATTTFTMPAEAVTVTATYRDSGSDGAGGGNGNSGGTPPPPPAKTNQQTTVITSGAIDKETGTTPDGKAVEIFTVQGTAVEQIRQAKTEGKTSVEFNIASSQTAITEVNIPSAVLGSAAGMNVSINTPHATLELPAALVNALAAAGQDLNLTVERGGTMADPAGGTVLGSTTEITTDIVGTTQVTIPLTGISIPDDPTERAAFLTSLAVFIYHSDGETELITGEILYDAGGNPVGLTFPVDKFSTFAVVKLSKRTVSLTIGSPAASLNSLAVALDAPAFVEPKSNRTLVPLRFIGEALGAKVEWNPTTRQVKIKDGDKEILLTLDSATALVNGQVVTIECAPVSLPPGRSFVPLRFIGEALGAQVAYDKGTQGITVTREYGE